MAKRKRRETGPAVSYKRRRPMKRPELVERLRQVGGDKLASFAEWVLDTAPKHHLKIVWGDTGPMLKYVPERDPDKVFKFGQLEATGVFGQRKGIFGQRKALAAKDHGAIDELPRAGHDYLQTIASLMDAEIKTFTSPRGHVFNAVVVGDRAGDWPQLATLAPKKKQWFAAIDEAIRAIEKVLDRGEGKPEYTGQGTIPDSKTRKAIENYAMSMAIAHYTSAGYQVKDTSREKPYDLACYRGEETLRVEVKGTQSEGKTVLLTMGEVDNARTPDIRTDLFVVGRIRVTKTQKGPELTGGKVVCQIKRWIPDDDALTPTEFRYEVPC